MASTLYPSLYQINTRVWLTRLTRELGRPATLDDIPDAELDSLAQVGFDWIWFLSVWQTGQAGREISCNNHGWRMEFEETLPDLCEDDIVGSGFAITSYEVHCKLGGNDALGRLREHSLALEGYPWGCVLRSRWKRTALSGALSGCAPWQYHAFEMKPI